MHIKPCAAIRQNYNEISRLCKETGEPVYLTKNGEGDLVVMDIEAFTRREQLLKLRQELLNVQQDRLNGVPDYTIEEVDEYLRRVIEETVEDGEE